jgi:uncharacterized protein (TIGR03437 family)
LLKLSACLFGIALAICADADAQTVTSVQVTSVQNPASNTLAGLPNYGIAQASIFIVYGSGLGPATLVEGTTPYATSLAGTSIQISAGDLFKVYSPYIVYTSATQVAAIMPSNVPAAPVSIQVTYNGTVGHAFSTSVLANNFGISTMNQTGGGPAVITYPTSTAPFFGLLSNSNAAMSGNTYTMWGTGLGAAVGGNSDSDVSVFGNVGPAIQVFVGGVQAAVTYYGRSPGAPPGLDQINFTIPSGLAGCNVSLVVQTGMLVSNTTTLPIAPGGGACSDAANPSGAAISAALASKGSVALGLLTLGQSTTSIFSIEGPIDTMVDVWSEQVAYQAGGTFLNYYNFSPTSRASAGSCTVSGLLAAGFARGLDAGIMTVTTPTGAGIILTDTSTGSYPVTLFGFPAGSYMISGGGGFDVGAFSVSVPATGTFVWSNQVSVSQSQPAPATTQGNPIIRSQGQTITWTGAAPNSYVYISGTSPVAYGSSTAVSFFCTAPASAGQFIIPPSVLLALPVTQYQVQGFLKVPDGQLTVSNTTYPATFSASGLDAGYATVSNSTTVYVSYQ